jgi:hypothetical protein
MYLISLGILKPVIHMSKFYHSNNKIVSQKQDFKSSSSLIKIVWNILLNTKRNPWKNGLS